MKSWFKNKLSDVLFRLGYAASVIQVRKLHHRRKHEPEMPEWLEEHIEGRFTIIKHVYHLNPEGDPSEEELVIAFSRATDAFNCKLNFI